jgi:RND superfamily putative drug exporter
VALAGLTVMMLAPALLVLVGKTGTWWVPKWSERVVPHIDIEGATMDRTDGSEPGGRDADEDEPPPGPRKDSMRL